MAPARASLPPKRWVRDGDLPLRHRGPAGPLRDDHPPRPAVTGPARVHLQELLAVRRPRPAALLRSARPFPDAGPRRLAAHDPGERRRAARRARAVLRPRADA